MIIHDHKRALQTIIGKRHPSGELETAPVAPSVTQDEDGAMDHRHAAAEDVIMALKDGHAGRLMEALANFHDLHMAHRDKATSSEE